MYLLKKAPITAKMTDGIPIFRISLLLIPFLNTATLERLLKIWNMAVIAKTEWKSKNKPAKGTKKSEEPNPPTVPRISESKAKKINKIINSTLVMILTQICVFIDSRQRYFEFSKLFGYIISDENK